MTYFGQKVFGNFKPTHTQRAAKRSKELAKPVRSDRDGNDEKHLDLIRKLPCCLPGCSKHPGGEAHHMKSTGVRGMGMRSPDRYAVPLCHDHHINGVERVGSRNEIEWFAKRGVQALDLAAALWGSTGDLAKMTAIVVTNKRGK